ncbi:MAG: hypothetical protein M3N46_01320, partial [Actinomycetota bacterium]|nr:hypothetical protein [Actinomycetota bacterium]
GLRAHRRVPLLVISGGRLDNNLPDDVERLTKPIELPVFLGAVDRLLEVSAFHRDGEPAS